MVDATLFYFLIYGTVFTIISATVFVKDHTRFSKEYFMQGFWGSLASTLAATLADFALGLKHAP